MSHLASYVHVLRLSIEVLVKKNPMSQNQTKEYVFNLFLGLWCRIIKYRLVWIGQVTLHIWCTYRKCTYLHKRPN